jgi:hypothetical protein
VFDLLERIMSKAFAREQAQKSAWSESPTGIFESNNRITGMESTYIAID